jgi:hypothetical protein
VAGNSVWTKKTPKSPGLYWFWHSGSEVQIVRVIKDDDPDGDWLLNLMTNVQIRIGDTPIYYMKYHFGPKIHAPSVRDLIKRDRRRGTGSADSAL